MRHLRLVAFSQRWFAIVQDVLHADWQDAWHSPHALLAAAFRSAALTAILMCFIVKTAPFYILTSI
jgi:hypothetical protein